jgi:ABC-type glycerol-3-phosphate transport system substrate-binding protein
MIRLGAAVIAVLALFGQRCTVLSNPTLTLWTSQPEVAAYVETFNAAQDDYRIEVSYVEDASARLLRGEDPPDVLVDYSLWSRSLVDRFQPLDSLFEEERVDADSFYSALLSHCVVDGEHRVLPVSFSLPAIIFRRTEDAPDRVLVSLTEMEALAAAFNESEDGVPHRLGFSPRWSSDFLYHCAVLFDARFRESSGGTVRYSGHALTDAVYFLRTWIQESNGGLEAEQAFSDKYLYDPGYRLVQQRRILFSYMDIAELAVLPEQRRDSLGFFWFSKDERIPVDDDVLFAAVPRDAENPAGAEMFLSWFFDAETQRSLLQTTRLKRMRSFGIAGGFSSVVQVNERYLAQSYPQLVGHVPPAHFLLFPEPLPVNWQSMRDQVVEPWLQEALRAENTSSDLSEQIRLWLRQRGAD